MSIRLFFISLLFVIFTAIVLLPTHSTATQSATYWAWCFSDASFPTVYHSRLFDSGISADANAYFDVPLARQFGEYVKGRYDTRGEASCGLATHADAVRNFETRLAQLRQQNKQLIEVPDWNYVRDETTIKASFNRPRKDDRWVDVEGGLHPDHVYCVAGPFNNTIYYAEPTALTDPSTNPTVGYFKFLQQKYSFKGDAACPIISEPHAKLYLNARLAGARAAGKQVVNTGWPPASAITTAQAPNDRYQDNDQPAQRPAANRAAPANQVRDVAAKEVTPALTYCQSNRAISQGYDCACLQVKIYDYRIEHPAETLAGTPALASFFDGKEFQCDKCINASKAKYFAHDQAKIAGLSTPTAQDCAAEKFVSLLHANPAPSRAKEELDSAIKACRQ